MDLVVIGLILFLQGIWAHPYSINAKCNTRKGSKTLCYDETSGEPQRCVADFTNVACSNVPEVTNTCSNTEFCLQKGNERFAFANLASSGCGICNRHEHGPDKLTDPNGNQTWWQSDTMMEGIQYPTSVNITFNFGKTYDVNYVQVSFITSRPQSYAIYKKRRPTDDWIPWQYYSGSCRETYKLNNRVPVLPGKEAVAICTDEFSDISPTNGDKVAFGTLNYRPSHEEKNVQPKQLQEWTAASDVMIVLNRLNTYGDEKYGDPRVLKSYFYAINDIAIGARCSCNGHANLCVPSSGGIYKEACQCEHNTTGVDCEKCLPMYQDRPWRPADTQDANECLPCLCNDLADRCFFDEKLYNETGHGGHCIECKGNTDGPHCDVCKQGHYRVVNRADCLPCNCHEVGSLTSECDRNGQCQCKPGVEGRRCDRCKAGFYDLTEIGCKDCGCSEAGSLANCHQGQCVCKSNVEGETCDRCKPGFFNLDRNNTRGCSPCFCYGHTSACQSAPMFYEKTVTMDEGPKFKQDFDNIPTPFVEHQQGYDPVYFNVPEHILSHIKHYSSPEISFKFRKESASSPLSRHDIILSGSGITLSAPITSQSNLLPRQYEQEYKYVLGVTDNSHWQPKITSEQMFLLLSNVTSVKIRMTYSPRDVGYLWDFKLKVASSIPSLPVKPVATVEKCICLPEYVGQFCETCASGFKREKPADLLSKCVKCECNGHSQNCEAESGECFCTHNTTGAKCDQCARGFYGDATSGTVNDCKLCECPDDGPCEVKHGLVYCTECPVGFTGQRCDYCAEGYFGDPVNNIPCKPCGCNQNSDPNYIQQCDKSGRCLHCYYNTTGFDCEMCFPGFWGNATSDIKGDCQQCHCYGPGTVKSTVDYDTLECRQSDGQCDCQPNVIGQHCDQCEDGFFNLASGTGCKACDCDVLGSSSSKCDVISGQCQCKPGVTGRRCDKCSPNYFGFHEGGCRKCDCDFFGSSSQQCHLTTGQCECKENVVGLKCDQCAENRYSIQQGCLVCDDCYRLIQERKNHLNSSIVKLKGSLDYIHNTPVKADDPEFKDKVKEVQEELDELQFKAKDYSNKYSDSFESIKNVNTTLVGTLADVQQVLKTVGYLKEPVLNHFYTDRDFVQDQLSIYEEQFNGVSSNVQNLRQKHTGENKIPELDETRSLVKEITEKEKEVVSLAVTYEEQSKRLVEEVQDIIYNNTISQEVTHLLQQCNATVKASEDTKKLAQYALEESEEIYNQSALVLNQVEEARLPEFDDVAVPNDWYNQTEVDINIRSIEKIKEKAKEEQYKVEFAYGEAKKHVKARNDIIEELNKELDEINLIYNMAIEFEESLQHSLDVLEDKNSGSHKSVYLEEVKKVEKITQQVDLAFKSVKELEAQIRSLESSVAEIQKKEEIISKTVEKRKEQNEKNEALLKQVLNTTEALTDKLNGYEDQIQDLKTTVNSKVDVASNQLKKSNRQLRKALKINRNVTRIHQKVEDGLQTMKRDLKLLSNLKDLDDKDLDEWEQLLNKVEESLAPLELHNANLDGDNQKLLEQRQQLSKEISLLKRESEQLFKISSSLPSKCVNVVNIEQQ
ncbi:unnamed protein product [Bursaphelenchus okinawaensis]|uniref:Uncharacterized protein n=1 Tax=Bursaphelenchus okinawaensis TaxID=465554 RepID=A0A811LNL0_9BILA|nr:unnamed protein product [Bursaphelenchus okinawaensis]CAG9126399.1 unnamed protein product [Bursaphelenchus okinawaensis]